MVDIYEGKYQIDKDADDEIDDDRIQKMFDQNLFTIKAEKAMRAENFERAICCLKRNAEVCRILEKEDDAYLLEHQAFLCEEKLIYKKAHVSLTAFKEVPHIEGMKKVLTQVSEEALREEKLDAYVNYSLLNARICRVQGQADNAFLLENSAYQYGKQAQEIQKKKKAESVDLEKEYMQKLAEKFY